MTGLLLTLRARGDRITRTAGLAVEMGERTLQVAASASPQQASVCLYATNARMTTGDASTLPCPTLPDVQEAV